MCSGVPRNWESSPRSFFVPQTPSSSRSVAFSPSRPRNWVSVLRSNWSCIQPVVDDAPVPELVFLEQPRGDEELTALAFRPERLEHPHGVVLIHAGEADLRAEVRRFVDREPVVRGQPPADVGVHAEVLRLLRARDAAEQAQRLRPFRGAPAERGGGHREPVPRAAVRRQFLPARGGGNQQRDKGGREARHDGTGAKRRGSPRSHRPPPSRALNVTAPPATIRPVDPGPVRARRGSSASGGDDRGRRADPDAAEVFEIRGDETIGAGLASGGGDNRVVNHAAL